MGELAGQQLSTETSGPIDKGADAWVHRAERQRRCTALAAAAEERIDADTVAAIPGKYPARREVGQTQARLHSATLKCRPNRRRFA